MSSFGAIPGFSQGLLLDLQQELFLARLRGTYQMSVIEPESVSYLQDKHFKNCPIVSPLEKYFFFDNPADNLS